jgi:hypothetical protein
MAALNTAAFPPEEREAADKFAQYIEDHPEQLTKVRAIVRRMFGPDLDAVLLGMDEHTNNNNETPEA